MRPLSIHFPRELRRSFTRAAKLAFPREVFAFCLGEITPTGTLDLYYLYFPEILLSPSGYEFEVKQGELDKAVKLGSSLGAEVLVSLHSHPFPENTGIDDAAPSETDWDWCFPELPLGICSVAEKKGKISARYRFWPVIPQVILTS